MSGTVDPFLKRIFDKIPESDQTALFTQHGIINVEELVAKKSQLQQRQLQDVCSPVQMFLDVMCNYLEGLESVSLFTWEGFENYCEFTDNSGDNIVDEMSDQLTKKRGKTEDADPDGYNLTAEERKQMEQNVEDDPLTVKIRSFSSRSLQFETDEENKKKLLEDESEKTEVAFNGSVYYVKRCYYYQQQDGETVTVGIRGFTRNEKKAICALVVPFQETVIGPGLEEEPPIGVAATYEEDQAGLPSHVQVRMKVGSEPILPLTDLKPCSEPSKMPELLFEPQEVGQPPHNFGYVYENDGSNRGEEREEIPFIDLFAGSGGYHQGVTQVPGLKGVAAVEYWPEACKTFAKNNPKTPVFCMKVEDFLDENGSTPADFRKKLGSVKALFASPPCQSFSGSNRNVDHNGKKDLYRKGLSLLFFEAMQISGALIGVFENVEGMWRRPNIYFLKKIILDGIRAGYQVRCRLLFAHKFGDPQARPRLFIFVAKKFVEMPNVIETHGPGKHPYVTVGHAWKALDKRLKKVENNTSMAPIPNLEGWSMSEPDKEEDILNLDKPAGTIRCGGRVWNPQKGRAATVREVAQLQSYPPNYEFLGSLTDQYKQIGNAVPGKMAKAVALAVAESLRFVYDEELEDDKTDNDVSMEDCNNKEEDARD